MAFSVGIKITNAQQCDPPEFPDLPECSISDPTKSTFMSFQTDSTGRMVRSETVTYRFSVVPHKVGKITIPGIPIHADGQTIVTQPVQIDVRQPPQSRAPDEKLNNDSSDNSLMAEITCDQSRLYVGQTAEFTLTIWVKAAYYNGRPLSASFMVGLVSGNFGPFDTDQVAVTQATRKSDRGGTDLYYLLRLPAFYTIPQTGSPLFDDITVAVNYPTRIQSDGFIFDRPRVVSSTPVSIRPTVNLPEIVSLPTENRPADFTGIVGDYSISATAVPTRVRVGDPIRLDIVISGYPVETLSGPDLSNNTALNQDFRVTTDSAAGILRDNTKTFTHTIRAKNADVGWIPEITFSFFNPKTGEYTTAKTKPIPLLVEKVEQLDAADLTNISTEGPQTQASNLERSDGLRGNRTNESELLATEPPVTSVRLMLATFAPPIAFLLILGLCTALRSGRDEALQRRKSALRTAERRIETAQNDALSPADFHGEIAAAMSGYLADRCNQPPARLLGAAAIEFLQKRGVNPELIEQWITIQRRCDEAAYAGGEKDTTLANAARKCLQKIEGVTL